MNGANKVRIALGFIALIIMILALARIDYSNYNFKDFLVPIATLLLILAQIIPVFLSKKNEK